jgi:hypothetical protein
MTQNYHFTTRECSKKKQIQKFPNELNSTQNDNKTANNLRLKENSCEPALMRPEEQVLV